MRNVSGFSCQGWQERGVDWRPGGGRKEGGLHQADVFVHPQTHPFLPPQCLPRRRQHREATGKTGLAPVWHGCQVAKVVHSGTRVGWSRFSVKLHQKSRWQEMKEKKIQDGSHGDWDADVRLMAVTLNALTLSLFEWKAGKKAASAVWIVPALVHLAAALGNGDKWGCYTLVR